MGSSTRVSILSLYKRLYRLHATQNEPFKSLSNTYLKAEFRAIRDMDKNKKVSQKQWNEFVDQWTRYESMLISETVTRRPMDGRDTSSKESQDQPNKFNTPHILNSSNPNENQTNDEKLTSEHSTEGEIKSNGDGVDSDILDWGSLNPEQRQKVMEMQRIFKK